MNNKEIIEFLSQDFLLNVDMIDCIKRNNHKIIDVNKDGVLIEDVSSKVVMISTNNFEDAKKLIDKIPDSTELIVGHQDLYYEYLKERFNAINEMYCYQTVYTESEPLPISNCPATIKLLTEEYTSDVFSQYHNDFTTGIEYIRERIESKTMFGAFIDNKLVGFVGTHEEGSIGLLDVLPEYRKIGIATSLQIYATNLALYQNRIPYGQVVIGNEESTKLQEKLGFKISKEKIYWLTRML
ncbi:GNAT family N-acetyltransferase [Clostridium gasigenes]|uniref:GNAT family N-acetyltransferase n=1 Tax=Clostridium gasigenes TaxID=94869 RepID=UPI001C0AE720|nr:GNAT family N-acetyltransferase [Clostridium gasigenes]MBU3107916.1 GNAT family N-acetyltransferase [Clostridium gasigenes]